MNIRFYNAKILVPAENHKFQITEGELWVKGKEICYIGDGKTGVDAVCKNGEVLVWEREIDAKGNLLMPGFKDAHTHTAMTFLRSYADDLPLQDWLNKQVFPKEGQLTEDDVYWLNILGIMEYLTSGITSNFDMYFFPPVDAKASVDTGFRTVQTSGLNNFGGTVELMEENYHIVNEMSDLTSFIVGFHAEYTTSKELMEGVAKLAQKLKSPVWLHNSETKLEVAECKERWGMIADDIWDMILGKAGRLPGKLAPEIIEKAEREGRKFFDGNPQDNYPDQLEKYRKMMLEKQWDKGQDDEELFEYAMHPAQYEAYKSGKAKEDFLADVKKRREEKANATTPVEAENKTKVLTVDVNGQPYRVTVAYGAVDPATLTAASGAVPAQTAPAPVGEGKDVLSPLEGKFFLVKNAQETPKKVGEKVNKGDVICYVEAMKTYNAIRAEYDGTITAICANSGDTVSEDDVLMKIV